MREISDSIATDISLYTDISLSIHWHFGAADPRLAAVSPPELATMTADLRSPEGQQLVRDLVTGSGSGGGILVTNAGGRSWMSHDTLAALRTHLAAHLAPYKQPSQIICMAAFPMTHSGKILKRELVAQGT